MATKIGLFNEALIELGNRSLVDTGEATEAGRALVTVYDRAVADCLSIGSWNFAMETIKATADTGTTPGFGFTEVFAKPSDWVRTVGISEDERFAFPLLHYYDDANFWSADSSPIYVRYVSNDTGLGLELTRWTPAFSRYVALELAVRVAQRVTQSAGMKEDMEKMRDKAKRTALNQDALNEPNPKFTPPGAWTQSRGGRTSRGDRGSRSNLTG